MIQSNFYWTFILLIPFFVHIIFSFCVIIVNTFYLNLNSKQQTITITNIYIIAFLCIGKKSSKTNNITANYLYKLVQTPKYIYQSFLLSNSQQKNMRNYHRSTKNTKQSNHPLEVNLEEQRKASFKNTKIAIPDEKLSHTLLYQQIKAKDIILYDKESTKDSKNQNQRNIMKELGIDQMLDQYVGKKSSNNVKRSSSHLSRYDDNNAYNNSKSNKPLAQVVSPYFKKQNISISKSNLIGSHNRHHHQQNTKKHIQSNTAIHRQASEHKKPKHMFYQRQLLKTANKMPAKVKSFNKQKQKITSIYNKNNENCSDSEIGLLGSIAKRLHKFDGQSQNKTTLNFRNSETIQHQVSSNNFQDQKNIHKRAQKEKFSWIKTQAANIYSQNQNSPSIMVSQNILDKNDQNVIQKIQKQQSSTNMSNKIDTMSDFLSIDTNYYGFSFKNKIKVTNPNILNKINNINETNKNQQTINININRVKTSLQQSNHQTTKGRMSKGSLKCSMESTFTIQQKNNDLNTIKKNQKQEYQTVDNINRKKSNHSNRYLGSGMSSKINMSIQNKKTVKSKPLLKQRYKIIKMIGKGLSGQVHLAEDILAQRQVAIKIISNAELSAKQYDFYRQVTHQNIIKYLNSFQQNKKRYIVLEYFPLTLKDLIKDKKLLDKLDEQRIRHIFKGIVGGLSHLHSFSIAHRDIKLQNIVISQDLQVVKFIDFGLCIDVSKSQNDLSTSFCGTLSYLPPQILQGKSHQPKKADIWSLGVLLYALSVQRMPFKGKNQFEILNKIMGKHSKLVFPENFQVELKNLIQNMLQKNPANRLTISQVLSHSWLSDY